MAQDHTLRGSFPPTVIKFHKHIQECVITVHFNSLSIKIRGILNGFAVTCVYAKKRLPHLICMIFHKNGYIFV